MAKLELIYTYTFRGTVNSELDLCAVGLNPATQLSFVYLLEVFVFLYHFSFVQRSRGCTQ